MSGKEKLTENPPELEVLPLEFKRLTAASSSGVFRCGKTDIDQYWEKEAFKKHESRRLRVTTVNFVDREELVAFYALTVKAEHENILEKSSRQNCFACGGYFGTIKLGWLAVQEPLQGKGIGRTVMGRVIYDFYEIVMKTGIYAMTLTSIDEKTAGFYEKLGFSKYGGGRQSSPNMLIEAPTVIKLVES